MTPGGDRGGLQEGGRESLELWTLGRGTEQLVLCTSYSTMYYVCGVFHATEKLMSVEVKNVAGKPVVRANHAIEISYEMHHEINII